MGLNCLKKVVMKGHQEHVREIRAGNKGYEMYRPMIVKWMRRRCSNMEPRVLFRYFVHFFDSGGHCFCYHDNSEWILRPTLDWLFHPRRPRSCICYLKHWHWLQAEIPFTKAVKFPQLHEAQQFCKTIMAENSDDIPLFPRYQPETERRLVTRKGVTCVTGKRMRMRK